MSRVNELAFHTNFDTYVSKNGLSVFVTNRIIIDGVEYIYVNERRPDGEKMLTYITNGVNAVGIVHQENDDCYIYQANNLTDYYNATLAKDINDVNLSMFSSAVVKDSFIIDGRYLISSLMS